MPTAPTPDLTLAPVLDGMLVVFHRVVAAIEADDDIDRRLVQSASSAANAIIRIVQTQARLANPRSALDAEIDFAFAQRGLDYPGNAGSIPASTGWPLPAPDYPLFDAHDSAERDDHSADSGISASRYPTDPAAGGVDPPTPRPVVTTHADPIARTGQELLHDRPDHHPAPGSQPPRPARIARAATARSRSALGLRGRHPPDGR